MLAVHDDYLAVAGSGKEEDIALARRPDLLAFKRWGIPALIQEASHSIIQPRVRDLDIPAGRPKDDPP
jgi:hypothetical protein